MFSKATANFVRQIDPEGSLIHVSRLNDSHKLAPMALVVKRNRIWFWQKPKYQPTDFTLSDLLQGDEVLTPGVSEKEFVTYQGTYGDKLSGQLDTEAASVSITLEGRGSTKLQSCFGTLKKEELNVKKLLDDSASRLLDMEHVLVKQLEKQADVLAVVKERILTTNSCSVTQTKKEQCTFQGMLGLVGMLGSSVKVCVKDSNNIQMDSDVSLEIPTGTVIAYSILELEIKKNGHYDICLKPGMGGIESDSTVLSWPSSESLDVTDGKCNGDTVPSQKGSEETDLSPLGELPQSVRFELLKRLQETLRDKTALSYLQCMLEDLCSSETLHVDGHMELLEGPAEDARLNAAHLLVSAMEELPDKTLRLLSETWPDFLEAFDMLLLELRESSEALPLKCLPAQLQENQAFQLAEQLLSSTNVTLRRDGGQLWAETGSTAGDLPLLLRLSTHGLSLLCRGQE